jgi:hypothetical protein
MLYVERQGEEIARLRFREHYIREEFSQTTLEKLHINPINLAKSCVKRWRELIKGGSAVTGAVCANAAIAFGSKVIGLDYNPTVAVFATSAGGGLGYFGALGLIDSIEEGFAAAFKGLHEG